MSKLLANNIFCAFLIVLINAVIISALIIITQLMGDHRLLFYRILCAVLFLGNILIRYVMKENSKTLAKYHLVIIIILVVIFYPLGGFLLK